MLEVKGLYKNFDGVQAVQILAEVGIRKVTSLMANGAGKTTVFNIVTDFQCIARGVLYQNQKFLV